MELDIELSQLEQWVESGLVIPSQEDSSIYYIQEDLERFRVIKNLSHDLEVNDEGIEVILGMRKRLYMMEHFLKKMVGLLGEHNLLTEDLVNELKEII